MILLDQSSQIAVFARHYSQALNMYNLVFNWRLEGIVMNQTWVTHLLHSKANRAVGKESTVFIAGPTKEYGQLMLKRPKHPDGFQGRDFKGNI